jgi:hypothetical protein
MTEVGISIIPYWDSLERNRELVRVADEGGLALVGIQDHPYQRHFFDTWSAGTVRKPRFDSATSLSPRRRATRIARKARRPRPAFGRGPRASVSVGGERSARGAGRFGRSPWRISNPPGGGVGRTADEPGARLRHRLVIEETASEEAGCCC